MRKGRGRQGRVGRRPPGGPAGAQSGGTGGAARGAGREAEPGRHGRLRSSQLRRGAAAAPGGAAAALAGFGGPRLRSSQPAFSGILVGAVLNGRLTPATFVSTLRRPLHAPIALPSSRRRLTYSTLLADVEAWANPMGPCLAAATHNTAPAGKPEFRGLGSILQASCPVGQPATGFLMVVRQVRRPGSGSRALNDLRARHATLVISRRPPTTARAPPDDRARRPPDDRPTTAPRPRPARDGRNATDRTPNPERRPAALA